MMHIELHVVMTAKDAANAENLRLIEFATEEYCENCGEPVAYVDDVDDFEACVLILDEDGVYLVCTYCALPVIHPGEIHNLGYTE